MIKTVCDGCGADINPATDMALRVARSDEREHSGRGSLPSHARPLDWCADCGLSAIDFLRGASRAR